MGDAALTSQGTQRFEFSGFLLDGRRRTLVDARGEPVEVNAKAFDTLRYFLEHPGEIIERSTLLEAIWPNVIVEENNLSQIVSALRRALGEGFIATVPRRGYQFVAAVRVAADDDLADRGTAGAVPARPAKENAAAAPTDERRRATGAASRAWPDRPAGRLAVAAAALLSIGAVFVAVERFFAAVPGVSGTPADPGALPKVAVLPCENLSPNADDAYFAAGMHEEILNRLAQLSGLRVVARTSVLQYGQARPPIAQIAAELDASAVMECSVRYAGSAVVVTAQLIDPGSETHRWSRSYPGDMSDLSGVFRMQADIAIDIANALDAELEPAEHELIAEPLTESPAAYVEFLKAVENNGLEPESRLAHLDRAIEIDPGFAAAYVSRAFTRLVGIWGTAIQSGRGGDVLSAPVDVVEQARLANADAARALALEREAGLAHFVLGATRLPFDKAAAEAEFERALALSPRHTMVLYLTAGFYLAELRIEESMELIDRIKQLDPNVFMIRTFLLLTRDLDALAELERRALKFEATAPVAHRRIALAELLRGNTREALRELRIAEQLGGEADIAPSGPTIYMYGRLGLTDEAKRMFEALIADSDAGEFVSDTEWMVANLGIGDVDKAYEFAARVAERPLPMWAADELWLVLNPLDDPSLEEPAFVELRRKLGYGD